MEIKDNVNEKEKKGNKKLNPLIVVIILVLLLIVVGLWIFLMKKDAKSIYYNVIDSGAEEAYVLLDNYFDEIDGNRSLTGVMNFNISNNSELTENDKALMNMINDLKINYEMAVDGKSDKVNLKVGLDYQGNDLVDLGMAVRNKDVYMNLGNLYDKNIKTTLEEDLLYWYGDKEDSVKVLITEFKTILKNNLKEEFFKEDEEVLNINGKEIKTSKYILYINSDDLYDLQVNMINDLKNNQKAIDALIEIKNSDERTVIDNLEYLKDNISIYDEELNVEIYLKKYSNDVVKIVLSNQYEKLALVKVDNDLYDITFTEYNMTKLVGSLLIKEKGIKLDYDYENVKLNIDINDNDMDLKLNQDGMEVILNTVDKNDKMNYTMDIIIDDGIEFKINMSGSIEEIKNVSDEYTNNFIDYNSMTEDDYMRIYENMYNNTNLINLVEDIMNLYNSYIDYNLDEEIDSLQDDDYITNFAGIKNDYSYDNEVIVTY